MSTDKIENLIKSFAAWLTTTIGFLVSNAIWSVGGLAMLLYPPSSSFVLFVLSVEAIVIGSALLVAGVSPALAVQLKLDELIRAQQEARNDMIGAEHKQTKDLEQTISEIEKGAEAP